MVILQNHQRTLIKGQTVSLTHFVLDVAMETTGKRWLNLGKYFHFVFHLEKTKRKHLV